MIRNHEIDSMSTLLGGRQFGHRIAFIPSSGGYGAAVLPSTSRKFKVTSSGVVWYSEPGIIYGTNYIKAYDAGERGWGPTRRDDISEEEASYLEEFTVDSRDNYVEARYLADQLNTRAGQRLQAAAKQVVPQAIPASSGAELLQFYDTKDTAARAEAERKKKPRRRPRKPKTPAWAWALGGVSAVLLLGALAYRLRKSSAAPQQV